MNIFQRLFGAKKPSLTIEHPTFGTIVYSKHDGWINKSFTVLGYSGIELQIDAGKDGPTIEQVEAYTNLTARPDVLSESIKRLSSMRGEMELPEGKFILSGLTIPSLRPEPQGNLWTLWFDCEGDDHFMFGVQSDDEWKTLYPFADD